MLNDMLEKGKAEKSDEQTTFATYKQFCTSTKQQKTSDIVKGKKTIDQLKADIVAADSDAARMAKEIAQLDSDLSTWNSEKEEKSAARNKAKADFEKIRQEYATNIEAIGGALAQAKAAAAAMPSGDDRVLLELSSETGAALPPRTRRLLASFLQTDSPEASLLQGTARAQEASRGGVIDLVKELKEKFEDEKSELEKKEQEAQGNFDLMLGDLLNQIENASEQRERNVQSKTQLEQASAGAAADLKETTLVLAQDQEFLKDLSKECEAKSEEYEKRQVARAGEITALKKAIEIMSSDEVAGAGQKHGVALGQGAGASLAQLRSEHAGEAQRIAAGFLRDQALRSNSQILSLLASRAGAEPMKKITKMIRDMVQKLMEEAAEEAEHKGFCDQELGTNKVTRDQKSEDSAELTAEIEELTADIAKLMEQAAALSDSIATIDAAVAKATTDRAEEKAKNTQTIAEATAAQKGTARALSVLRDYYESAATAASLQQLQAAPLSPVSTDDDGSALVQVGQPSTAQSGSGVIGMLEVIESDFARLLAETKESEDEADRIQKKFLNDSDTAKAVKSTDLNHKEVQRGKKESRLQSAKKDLKQTNEELASAMAYFEKLKPSCVDAGVSYEDRTARRKEEIESLKEALKILEEQ